MQMRDECDKIEKEYFDWICKIICNGAYSRKEAYIELLKFLHNKKFRCTIKKDQNRAIDGENLRLLFAYYNNYNEAEIKDILSGTASVLEVMVALAIRCEEIMDDPEFGDRTAQWFWKMVVNLGLGGMYDTHFNEERANMVIEVFLSRNFQPDGQGSLFRIKNCKNDLRKFEIWVSALWYLDTLV